MNVLVKAVFAPCRPAPVLVRRRCAVVLGGALLVLGGAGLPGCGRPDAVHVRVDADFYRAGRLQSAEPAAVIEDLLRQEARAVTLWTCPGLPPERIERFRTELARHRAIELRTVVSQEGCVASR